MTKMSGDSICGEIYDQFCEKRFDKLDEQAVSNHQEIIGLLRGQNGEPGLMERVNTLERVHQNLWKAICALLVMAGVPIIGWLKIIIVNLLK